MAHQPRGGAHQRRLVRALRRSTEEDVVFGQHGHGSQDEGQEEVEVDVVPGAVKPPATGFSQTRVSLKRV